MNFLLVVVGGGIGSLLRYLCQRWMTEPYQQNFPLATFVVNVSGCLLIGILYALSEKGNVLSPQTRLLLMTGFCGGFTTFSTFALENVSLMRSGHNLTVILYTVSSILLGTLAVYAGAWFTRLIN